MIILIRLRMNDHGKVDARTIHALQKMFGRRFRVGPIRSASVIWEPGIAPAEAMQMRVDNV